MNTRLFTALLTICTMAAGGPETVLFIGNSYTFANGGLDLHLAGFYAAAVPGSSITASSIVAGGATLQNHWYNPEVILAIESGEWDLVVMQEQSTRPVTSPLLMYEFADSLGNLVSGSGSEPAFFMTWARKNDPEMLTNLQAAYTGAASFSGAAVMPVGEAFRRSAMMSPEILLYEPDGSHPNPHGTYLAVCVLYAFIWEDTPVGVEYTGDPSISEAERLALQTIAWDTFLARGAD